MIKVIYSKTGEGKTRECVKEIENATNCKNIGVICRDGDFSNKLEYFADYGILDSKNITIFGGDTTIKDILESRANFDMLVIDGCNENFNEISNQIPYDRFKKVIITQQLSRGFGRSSKTYPKHRELYEISSVYIQDGKVIKNRGGVLEDYCDVSEKVGCFERAVVQDEHEIDIYCKLEDKKHFVSAIEHARDNCFSKGLFIKIHCQQ